MGSPIVAFFEWRIREDTMLITSTCFACGEVDTRGCTDFEISLSIGIEDTPVLAFNEGVEEVKNGKVP